MKKNVKIHGNVKCDCQHRQDAHYRNEGQCKKCGCTWFYPNVKYVKKFIRLKSHQWTEEHKQYCLQLWREYTSET